MTWGKIFMTQSWNKWTCLDCKLLDCKLTRMWRRGFIQWIDTLECVEGWYISSHVSKIILFHSGPLSPLNEPTEDNNTSYPLSPPLPSTDCYPHNPFDYNLSPIKPNPPNPASNYKHTITSSPKLPTNYTVIQIVNSSIPRRRTT